MNFILLTFISCLLLFCFICLGIGKFGLLRSYSAYAPKWDETVPMKNLNLWSIITFLAGFLLMPVLLQYSEGHTLQFLGFFTPIYLMGVAFTPKFESDKNEFKYHATFAILCAICAFLFIIFVLGKYGCVIGSLIIVLIAAISSKTLKTSLTFWSEMVMFLSMYLALII